MTQPETPGPNPVPDRFIQATRLACSAAHSLCWNAAIKSRRRPLNAPGCQRSLLNPKFPRIRIRAIIPGTTSRHERCDAWQGLKSQRGTFWMPADAAPSASGRRCMPQSACKAAKPKGSGRAAATGTRCLPATLRSARRWRLAIRQSTQTALGAAPGARSAALTPTNTGSTEPQTSGEHCLGGD